MASENSTHSLPTRTNSFIGNVARGLSLLAFVMLGVFLPVSTAGTSLGLVVLFVAALLLLPSAWKLHVWQEPFVWMGLLLFSYIGLHSFWMSWIGNQPVSLIGGYSELWRIPVLIAVFAIAQKNDIFWKALLTGAVILCFLYWLKLAGITILDPKILHLEGRRISAPLGLLSVGWIALERSFSSLRPWLLRAVALLVVLTIIFTIEGRTAHLSLLALSGLAGWLYFPRRWRWMSILLLPLVSGFVLINSKVVQSRMSDTLSIMQTQNRSAEVTSAGLRKAFYMTGLEIIRDHPWTGVGYDGIPDAYETRITRRVAAGEFGPGYAETTYSKPPNLHNEYIMQWAGGGVPAFLLLIGWLVSPLLSRGHSTSSRRTIAGLTVLFAIGCLFNSWLLDFTPGHIFVILVAWQLSDRYRHRDQAKN